MTIPIGYGQANMRFGGAALPNGAEVTFGFKIDNPGVTVAGKAGQIEANWIQSIAESQSAQTSLVSVLVKIGPDETGASAEVPGSGGLFKSGETAPPNVAALVSKRTESGGRRGRGRFYVPGIIESVISAGGLLDTTFFNEMQANCDEFVSLMSDDDMPLVLLHDNALTPTLVTSLQLANRVATQRRRLRR